MRKMIPYMWVVNNGNCFMALSWCGYWMVKLDFWFCCYLVLNVSECCYFYYIIVHMYLISVALRNEVSILTFNYGSKLDMWGSLDAFTIWVKITFYPLLSYNSQVLFIYPSFFYLFVIWTNYNLFTNKNPLHISRSVQI